MNLSNYSNFTNFTAPTPSLTPSPSFRSPSPTPSPVNNYTSPSPVYNYTTPSPVDNFAPSPVDNFSPSPVDAIPSPATFHRFNHSTSVSSVRQQEINFFLAYAGVTFCVVIIFVYFTRKHLYNLLVDSRKFVDITPGDTELKRVFRSDGESKSYGQFCQLDDVEVEHKSRTVGEGADI